MKARYPLLFWRAALLLLSTGYAHASHAQAPREPPASVGRNIVSLSPAELFYKTQLGYERGVGPHSAVGLLGSYHYGVIEGYKGPQATVYYRYFVKRPFPTGLYFHCQLSLLHVEQTADLVNIKTKQYTEYRYQAVSMGGGIGLGYRRYLVRKATKSHLLVNALLGYRGNPRPQPDFDSSIYRLESSFLGPDFGWYLGFSPGSMAFGLLSLDYQF
ncbi:hypothetical protein Q5H92_02475 [Hymenobacter sp. M29]|uniref:DUF3575 domain-containing protein n=1 Tax=Hymenobacter mellowenesis TaxID=3063995 RepID=A0ABT9A5U3_9BACT|nr:hypothetical protein [Hymenobacter sp. M29]MDO7845205.1 hypothetical protein [Hymenobacter sp. M29]